MSDDENNSVEQISAVPNLLDEDEYPESDISVSDDYIDEEEEDVDVHDGDDGYANDGSDSATDNDNSDKEDGSEDTEGDDAESSRDGSLSDDDDDDDAKDGGGGGAGSEVYYNPSAGEDIYGRSTGKTIAQSAQKYIPPALRNAAAAAVDEVRLLFDDTI